MLLPESQSKRIRPLLFSVKFAVYQWETKAIILPKNNFERPAR